MEGDVFNALERAAISLSDALTGGGIYAEVGAEPGAVLMRAHRMDEGIVEGLTALNLALRELDYRRSLTPNSDRKEKGE